MEDYVVWITVASASAAILAVLINSATFVRTGKNATKTDLITRINASEERLKADINEAKTDLTKSIDRVDQNLREHEDVCRPFRDDTKERLAALEATTK